MERNEWPSIAVLTLLVLLPADDNLKQHLPCLFYDWQCFFFFLSSLSNPPCALSLVTPLLIHESLVIRSFVSLDVLLHFVLVKSWPF